MERHRKFIAEISKDIKYDFTPSSTKLERDEEYEEAIRKEEAKYGKVTQRQTTNDNGQQRHNAKPLSVLEAKRKHMGNWTVIGKIVTVSEQYVIEVEANPPDNPEAEYKDARFIQLEDIEKLDDNERLDVILYNDDITNVVAGEIVEITGNWELKQKNKKVKVLTVVVNARSIKYVNRKEFVISNKDKEAFKKFADNCKVDGCHWNLRNRLTAMFAPNVSGHEVPKEGILRSIVGGDNYGQRGGGRVSTFMVGDPGTAKSTSRSRGCQD